MSGGAFFKFEQMTTIIKGRSQNNKKKGTKTPAHSTQKSEQDRFPALHSKYKRRRFLYSSPHNFHFILHFIDTSSFIYHSYLILALVPNQQITPDHPQQRKRCQPQLTPLVDLLLSLSAQALTVPSLPTTNPESSSLISTTPSIPKTLASLIS